MHWILMVVAVIIMAVSAVALFKWAWRLPEKNDYAGPAHAYGAAMVLCLLPALLGMILLIYSIRGTLR